MAGMVERTVGRPKPARGSSFQATHRSARRGNRPRRASPGLVVVHDRRLARRAVSIGPHALGAQDRSGDHSGQRSQSERAAVARRLARRVHWAARVRVGVFRPSWISDLRVSLTGARSTELTNDVELAGERLPNLPIINSVAWVPKVCGAGAGPRWCKAGREREGAPIYSRFTWTTGRSAYSIRGWAGSRSFGRSSTI